MDWTKNEIELIVADYFDMLTAELRGTDYNKTAHRNALLQKLPGRGAPAVEFKHCNISAILEQNGLPYIDGYKPRANYQRSLSDSIISFLRREMKLLGTATILESSPVTRDPEADSASIESIEVTPPTSLTSPRKSERDSRQRLIDWIRLGTERTALGEQGERFVIGLERRFLQTKDRPKLAEQIQWTSSVAGDGAGFDILSFTPDGKEKLIEVKTTNANRNTPFYVTANEIDCSRTNRDSYWLYRLFSFAGSPRLYRLCGALDETTSLEPIVFRGRPA